MDLGELKELLKENVPSYSKITASELATIMSFVDVTLEMDRKTLDYFYKMDVDDLLKSSISNNVMEQIKNQGWSFSDDGKSLIVFLKNN